MGLEERRKIKELRETTIPEREQEITEISGGATVKYEIDWDTLSDDLESLRFIDNVSCFRVAMAMRTICIDDLGKEAVRDGLKTIKLRNVKTAAERSIHFDKGVLEMNCVYAEKLSGAFSDSEIADLLSKSL